MTTNQPNVIRDQMQKSMNELVKIEQRNQFLFSCMSEGILPNGLKCNFQLANYVNDENFICDIVTILEDANSRILELMYDRNHVNIQSLSDNIDNLKNEAIEDIGEEESNTLFTNVRNSSEVVKDYESKRLGAKLRNLRQKVANATGFKPSKGSRKIFALRYKRKGINEISGAKFPSNLRKSRKNRPHHRKETSQEYVITPEDLEERNPIILSNQNVELLEDEKALLRKSPKFCPTPRGPIDEKNLYESFLRFRESVRWKWFFNKNIAPEDVDNDYKPQPWSTRTEKSAPVAHDCPELEAFLSSTERDIKDLLLRRKIKSNLNENQINFIKKVKTEYPRRGLRIRREDKGPRFVIVDAEEEDQKIFSALTNPTHYTEQETDPFEEFCDEIKFFAAEALEKEEINEKIYDFITNIDETHLARPKPLYKTHKRDENGEMINPVPIRTVTVGVNTPVQPLSKLCQLAIEHLTVKSELPNNCKSTKEVLRVINDINENKTPLPESTRIVLADVCSLYPNVDVEDGLQAVKEKLEANPSPLGIPSDTIVKGLRICMKCNCVSYGERKFGPNRGVAQGACHACDFSDIWMGKLTEKHIETNTVNTLQFSLYRDDGLDMLLSGEEELEQLKTQLNSLHPNITWTVELVKEGGYLDLWLMLENGKIEWRNYKKAPAIYVGPDSCHDPAVMSSIVKGVGLRLRINSSKDEYFEESVEDAARAFKVSGYNYQKTKQELLKFKSIDPVEEIKKEKVIKKGPEKGCQAFFITNYDPRVPHPRKLISRNYHHIASNPVLAGLFPRENLVGGTRRLKNLSEILSPTDQSGAGGDAGGDEPGVRRNGSYHCNSYREKSKCDACSYMVDTSYVTSLSLITSRPVRRS